MNCPTWPASKCWSACVSHCFPSPCVVGAWFELIKSANYRKMWKPALQFLVQLWVPEDWGPCAKMEPGQDPLATALLGLLCSALQGILNSQLTDKQRLLDVIRYMLARLYCWWNDVMYTLPNEGQVSRSTHKGRKRCASSSSPQTPTVERTPVFIAVSSSTALAVLSLADWCIIIMWILERLL